MNTNMGSRPFNTDTPFLPHTHAGLTQRSWTWVRAGLRRCREHSDDRQRCLLWCRKFPQHTRVWQAVLVGEHSEMVDIALATEQYHELPHDVLVWWERILQNHPFSAIFAQERYQQLLQKRADAKARLNAKACTDATMRTETR